MNYIDIIGLLYPNIQCYTYGDPSNYNDIQCNEDSTLPSQAELDSAILNMAKKQRIAELSQSCQQDIIGGFQSSALGTARIYDSEDVDQINLIGATLTTAPNHEQNLPASSMYYASRDVTTLEKSYDLHTYSQLRQVMTDGAVFKLSKLQLYAVKRAEIAGATDVNAVLAITWS